jgi:hypothetical protein
VLACEVTGGVKLMHDAASSDAAATPMAPARSPQGESMAAR